MIFVIWRIFFNLNCFTSLLRSFWNVACFLQLAIVPIVHRNEFASTAHILIQSPSLCFPLQSLLLLLLLSLETVVKAGLPIPQNSECPNTEGKNFLQNVKVNLTVLNSLSPKLNSRRPSDYLNRSTSPWTLQYVRTPDKKSVFFHLLIHHTHAEHDFPLAT